MPQAKPIPEGFHTLTPYLYLSDAGAAIEFYKNAFGAQEIVRLPGPDGKGVMHAELKIGDSRIMMSEEMPQRGSRSPKTLGGPSGAVHLYVEDADATFDRAVKAGAKVTCAMMDAPWGDRFGKLTDPFGHDWSIATHKEDVSPAEMQRRFEKMFSKSADCGGT
jgi:PhnB protein